MPSLSDYLLTFSWYQRQRTISDLTYNMTTGLRVIAWSERQITLSSIQTQIANSISYDKNYYKCFYFTDNYLNIAYSESLSLFYQLFSRCIFIFVILLNSKVQLLKTWENWEKNGGKKFAKRWREWCSVVLTSIVIPLQWVTRKFIKTWYSLKIGCDMTREKGLQKWKQMWTRQELSNQRIKSEILSSSWLQFYLKLSPKKRWSIIDFFSPTYPFPSFIYICLFLSISLLISIYLSIYLILFLSISLSVCLSIYHI